MVSPEPVESPKRVLQRWIDAGRPAVAIYALSVHDAEFRAFKRAIGVVAEGEARFNSSSRNPQPKRMRGEQSPIDPETAARMMVDLARVDIDATRRSAPLMGPITVLQQLPNNAARCFEFGQVCAPLPTIMLSY